MTQAYQEPTQPGDLALPLIVDAGFITKMLVLLRPTSQPVLRGPRCFHCAGALEQGCCPSCDRP